MLGFSLVKSRNFMPEKPYLAIARKYRPQTFASVIGQDPIVTTLKNALRMNKVSHAYIFCGLRGTGKTTLARLFAKALNCLHRKEEGEPCNECASCQEILLGKSLDVIEIDGASNRGIDDIREITDSIAYATANGRYKIIIIDEVHMLTKEAFNALLKTLEEPPPNVKFLFATTEPHKILPTVMSRCQRFDLARILPDVVCKKLGEIVHDMERHADDAALELITSRSEGSLRDAESLLDQIFCCIEGPLTVENVSSFLGLMEASILKTLDDAIEKTDLAAAFTIAEEIFLQGKDPVLFVEQLLVHFRAILATLLGQEKLLSLGERGKLSSLYSEQQCLYILDYLLYSISQMAKSPFKRIHLEGILLHLIRSKNRLNLSNIVTRLFALEKKLFSSESAPIDVAKSPIAPAPQAEAKPIVSSPPHVVESPPITSSGKKAPYVYDTLVRFAAVELEGTVQKNK
jgi:DNA polymerase III subunit gamma/tau